MLWMPSGIIRIILTKSDGWRNIDMKKDDVLLRFPLVIEIKPATIARS